MTIIEKLEQAKAQIVERDATIETLTAALAEKTASAEKATADLEAAQALLSEIESNGIPVVKEMQAKLEEEQAARAEIESLHAETADELEKARAAVEDFETAVQGRAQEIVGASGTAPVAVTTAGDKPLSVDELVAELSNLKKTNPKAATAFIQQHKDKLWEAARG